MIFNFNLSPLLARSELDLRGAAMKDSSLRAEWYFGKLEELIQTLPDFLDGLKSFPEGAASGFDGDASIMSKKLPVIGYTKAQDIFDTFFYQPEAERRESAGKLLAMLEKLYVYLASAYSEKGWRNLSYREDVEKEQGEQGNYSGLTLARLIYRFDTAERNRKPRILAVDDVSVVLGAISAALQGSYEVFCLSRAEQVEKFLVHTIPDLFLLDIEMPGMNGHKLVKIIRDFEEHKDTPIMFLTGNATVQNFQLAMEQSVDDFISKPVDPDVLLKKVNAKISKKRF